MLLPKRVHHEFNRRGFYHPVAILVLAAITLSFALIFYLNSSVFFKTPEKTPQSQISTSPSPSSQKSPVNETASWKTYSNSKHKITFQYPSDTSIDGPNNANVNTETGEVTVDWSFKNNDEYLFSLFVSANELDKNLKLISERKFNGLSWKLLDSPFCSHDTCDKYQVIYYYRLNDKSYYFSVLESDKKSQRQIEQILSTFKFTD